MTHLTNSLALQCICPVCSANSNPLDVIDLSKSCGVRNEYLPLSGIPIYYFLCEKCGFCFAPEMHNWEISQFENKIYNAEYIEIDPDCVEVRPHANAKNLIHLFGNQKNLIRHLDYGGGGGY